MKQVAINEAVLRNDWDAVEALQKETKKNSNGRVVEGDIIPRNGTQRKEIEMNMAHLGYTFRLNVMNDDIEVNNQPLSNGINDDIMGDLSDRGYRNERLIELSIRSAAKDNAYHPIKDYLNGLEWNGEDTIKALSLHFQGDQDVIYMFLRRWFIQVVAKVIDEKQSLMLVLEGPQGIGKSYFARWLCSGLGDRYFSDDRLNLKDKDTLTRIIRLFLWEVQELPTTMRTSDIDALKAFITQVVVNVRKAYDRKDTIKPVVCSYIGTMNNDQSGLFSDPTSNRRFLVMPINGIDRGYVRIDVNQVWAQAMHLYRNGEAPELTEQEQMIQATINNNYEAPDPIRDIIETFYRPKNDGFVSSRELITIVNENGKFGNNDTVTSRLIGKVMRKLGYPDAKKDNKIRGYKGLAKKGFQKPA